MELPILTFAYPFGQNSGAAVDYVHFAGYIAGMGATGFTADQGLGNLFVLQRVEIRSSEDPRTITRFLPWHGDPCVPPARYTHGHAPSHAHADPHVHAVPTKTPAPRRALSGNKRPRRGVNGNGVAACDSAPVRQGGSMLMRIALFWISLLLVGLTPRGAHRTAASRARITAGPACPVSRSDVPCPDQPYAGTLIAFFPERDRRQITQSRRMRTGIYRISLARRHLHHSPGITGRAPVASELVVPSGRTSSHGRISSTTPGFADQGAQAVKELRRHPARA